MVARGDDGLPRCSWCTASAAYMDYHDQEWGAPVHDDRRLFECLSLEVAQAGLSWLTILNKREGYRQAFDGFDPERVVAFTPARIARMLNNPDIVRHRGKIESTVSNARHFLELQARYGSFDHWLWQHVDHRPIVSHYRRLSELPVTTPLSDSLSRELRALGFRFVGSTTVQAFLQAVGVFNDHLIGCHRHPERAA